MNELQKIMAFCQANIRWAETDGRLAFEAEQVCDVFGVKDRAKVYKGMSLDELYQTWGEPAMVTEPGLWQLISIGDSAQARAFQKVLEKVLTDAGIDLYGAAREMGLLGEGKNFS